MSEVPNPTLSQHSPRKRINAALLLVCSFGAVYFFYLHLETWWPLLLTLNLVILAVRGVAGFTKPLREVLVPRLDSVLDYRAITPLLLVVLGVLVILFLTTASVTIRLLDSPSAMRFRIAAPDWSDSPVDLSVDADAKRASRRYWFHVRASDITISPLGTLSYAAHTARCIRPGTAIVMRVPNDLPARNHHVVCLLPASGLRLPFPNDPSRSPYSALIVVKGQQYRIEDWKLSALFFGDDARTLEEVAGNAKDAIERAGSTYFDSRVTDISDQDRREYFKIWASNTRKLPTMPLLTGETVYVEIDQNRSPILRQLFVIGRDTLELLFVEHVNETKIVSQFGAPRD